VSRAWRRELLGRAFEDLLDQRLKLSLFPDGAGAQPLERGPRQREVQGDCGEFRPSRAGSMAMARPMPREAPLMSATRPASLMRGPAAPPIGDPA
jgi:hypothetical protein